MMFRRTSVCSAVCWIAFQTCCFSANPCDPPAGLVSWWKADGTASDSMGTNHGVLTNGASYAAGKFGQAFSFDGVDDFVEVADAANLNFPPGSTGTFEFWFFQTRQNYPVHFLGKRIEPFTDSFNYQVGFGWEVSGNPFPTGLWIHLAQVYDTNGITVYTNGIVHASVVGASFLPTNSVPLRIGTSDSLHHYGQSLAGLMDEIRIYNRALSRDEILSIVHCDRPPVMMWQPEGWTYWMWPYAYDSASGDWYWLNPSDTQWVYGYPPGSGWRTLSQSGLASGWSWWAGAYGYDNESSVWYWRNAGDMQWCVNMRTSQWFQFGE